MAVKMAAGEELMMYQKIIKRFLEQQGSKADPRHVEAWMRLQYGTLDSLLASEVESEVKIAVACIDHGGLEHSEELAQSYGL